MDKKLEPIVKAVQEKFGATFEEFRDEVHLFVKPEQIVEALTLMRDEQNFELLSALTAVDYYPQEAPRFHVIYQLTSICEESFSADQNASKRKQPQSPDSDQCV